MALNPGHADNILYYAHLHAALGRLKEAVAAKRRATELDPMNPNGWSGLSIMYRTTGQFDLARAAMKRLEEVAPEWQYAACAQGMMLLLERDPAGALASYEHCPNEVGRLWGTAVAQNDLGNSTASQVALAALIARYSQEKSDAGPYQVAQVYASRGDPDRAFEWLNRSVAERDSGIAALKYDLFLRKVRDDPRYKLLLKSVKLPAD